MTLTDELRKEIAELEWRYQLQQLRSRRHGYLVLLIAYLASLRERPS